MVTVKTSSVIEPEKGESITGKVMGVIILEPDGQKMKISTVLTAPGDCTDGICKGVGVGIGSVLKGLFRDKGKRIHAHTNIYLGIELVVDGDGSEIKSIEFIAEP